MKTRALNKNFNNDLVYGALKLCCVHGGRDHKTSSSSVIYSTIAPGRSEKIAWTCFNGPLFSLFSWYLTVYYEDLSI
jgi:hypothetical protein